MHTTSSSAALIAELADYLGAPVAVVQARCSTATATLAQQWRVAAPATPEAITAFYRHADEYLYDLTWWHARDNNSGAALQAQALQAALAHHAHRVLDFGSGIGSLGLLFAEHGMETTLAEINPRLHDYARWRFARRGLTAHCIDPQVQPLPPDAFDFISAIDVLEHLPDPAQVLADLAAALRPGGAMFLHMPATPDAMHPMHLWHGTAVVLEHLRRSGLWLVQADDTTLLVRRGEGPRYALAPALELLPDEGEAGGLVRSFSPLLAMRLNPQAYRLLAALQHATTQQHRAPTAHEVAMQRGMALVDVLAFLESLVAMRMLIRKPPITGHWPRVSVIIPAHGRPAATRACVESLLALDYPTERLEIIVVDDASQPPLAPFLANLPVRLLRQEQNIGQSAARNLAATTASGEVVAFIDNDCIAEAGWLKALLPYLEDATIGIVGGRVLAPPPTGHGQVAAFEAVRSPLDMGAAGGEVGAQHVVMYLPTCNMLVRRDVMLRHGFDAAMLLGEDVDFTWRARRDGWRAWYVPEGRIIHHHRVRLWSFLRRRFDYGSSEADLQRRHPEGWRTMPLPLLNSVLLVALALHRAAPRAGAALAALALAGITGEIITKAWKLQRLGGAVPLPRVVAAVLRQHHAALYHLGANVTRYYSLPLLAVALWQRNMLPPVLLLVLLPPLSDYQRLKPAMSLPAFVALYWLELAAYQLGVWRGCQQRRSLRPLLPRLRLTR